MTSASRLSTREYSLVKIDDFGALRRDTLRQNRFVSPGPECNQDRQIALRWDI
jgi:hypothetical protein